MCRRKKYDVIACICFHKRKYSDFCPKVAKYIDKMCKGDKNCLYMNVKKLLLNIFFSILVNRSDTVSYIS